MAKHVITPSTIIRRSEVMLSSDLGNETVMMDIDQGLYYGLDDIGTRLWVLIEQPVSVRSLCDQLLTEYEVTPQECEQEVMRFLDELSDHNIVEVVDHVEP